MNAREPKNEFGLVTTGNSDLVSRVLDRAVSDSVSTIYGPALDLLRELIDESALLQVRILTSGRRELAESVVAGGVFQRVLSLLDTAEVLLRAGQVFGARLVLRSLIEASWQVEWMLRADTERRVRQFYVLDLRERVASNRAFIPGTQEQKTFQADVTDFASWFTDRTEEAAKLNVKRVLEHMDEYPDLKEVDDEIAGQKKKIGDLRWFELFDGPRSYADLARKLQRGQEYRILYRGLSHAVHGSWLQNHFSVLAPGKGFVRPIRSLDKFAETANPVWGVGLRVLRFVVLHFREGELPAFQRRFFPNGKPRWNLPEVEIQEDLTLLGS